MVALVPVATGGLLMFHSYAKGAVPQPFRFAEKIKQVSHGDDEAGLAFITMFGCAFEIAICKIKKDRSKIFFMIKSFWFVKTKLSNHEMKKTYIKM